jgi:hypothetical protein
MIVSRPMRRSITANCGDWLNAPCPAGPHWLVGQQWQRRLCDRLQHSRENRIRSSEQMRSVRLLGNEASRFQCDQD